MHSFWSHIRPSLHLELNPLPNYSGIHSKVVIWSLFWDWIHFESGFHYFERGFPLQNEVIPNMTPIKEWISTPVCNNTKFTRIFCLALDYWMPRSHLHVKPSRNWKPRKVIIAKWSRTSLSRGSYGVYVAITGLIWLLRSVLGNLLLSTTWTL